jgi:hypothetical protein
MSMWIAIIGAEVGAVKGNMFVSNPHADGKDFTVGSRGAVPPPEILCPEKSRSPGFRAQIQESIVAKPANTGILRALRAARFSTAVFVGLTLLLLVSSAVAWGRSNG